MALQNPVAMSEEHTDLLAAVIRDLDKELGDPPDKLLLDAVYSGELSAVREASNSLQGQSFARPKLRAIERGRPDLLRCLLESDALIDECLVEAACISKDKASILTLLEFGWPINEPLSYDQSVLWAAVDDVDFACFLVNSGADVNVRSRYNISALSIAVATGNIDAVRFLMSQDADIAQGDLLHCAAKRNNQSEGAELVEELVQRGAKVNAHSFDNAAQAPFRKLRTPLHIAAKHDNVPVAKALLKYGANSKALCVQAREPTEPTVLQEAIGSGRMIELLTASG